MVRGVFWTTELIPLPANIIQCETNVSPVFPLCHSFLHMSLLSEELPKLACDHHGDNMVVSGFSSRKMSTKAPRRLSQGLEERSGLGCMTWWIHQIVKLTHVITMCPASDNCNYSTNFCIWLKCAYYFGPFPAFFQYRTTLVQTTTLAPCLRLVKADLFLALNLANPMSQTFSAERAKMAAIPPQSIWKKWQRLGEVVLAVGLSRAILPVSTFH